MDTNVAGLNKVFCFFTDATHDGHSVTISDGVNTWEKELDENHTCTFMIPSMPAPAKRTYTVRLYNGDTTAATLAYSRQIELGFGDSLRIGLYTDDEPVTKGSIPLASSSRTGGVRIVPDYNNGLYLSGNNIMLATASSDLKGGVKLGNNMSIDAYAKINPYNIEYGTSSKTSGSSYLAAGRIYCQYE